MSSIDFIVPLSYTLEDNETYVNKVVVFVKDCAILKNLPKGTVKDECEGFNFNLCGNDEKYFQPFIQGDILYNQFPLDIDQYFYLKLELINSETGEDFFQEFVVNNPDSIVAQFLSDADRTSYVNININTSNSVVDNISCFYMKLKLYKCDLSSDPDFINCVITQQAEFPDKPIDFILAECYDQFCGDLDTIITEPYEKVKCNKPSLLLKGNYSGHDCDNYFYGIGDIQSIYKLAIRVYGVVEPNGFDTTETVNNNKKVKSSQKERFLLRTQKIPYYVATQLQRAFNSQQLNIDDIDYSGAIKLNKNFDEGSMWIIEENIFIECNELDYGCN